jgi:hypothetical protein
MMSLRALDCTPATLPARSTCLKKLEYPETGLPFAGPVVLVQWH